MEAVAYDFWCQRFEILQAEELARLEVAGGLRCSYYHFNDGRSEAGDFVYDWPQLVRFFKLKELEKRVLLMEEGGRRASNQAPFSLLPPPSSFSFDPSSTMMSSNSAPFCARTESIARGRTDARLKVGTMTLICTIECDYIMCERLSAGSAGLCRFLAKDAPLT
ncbi:MAG: hypothetical protein WCK65_12455, partial [Rhodospirillaceae bacterium]